MREKRFRNPQYVWFALAALLIALLACGPPQPPTPTPQGTPIAEATTAPPPAVETPTPTATPQEQPTATETPPPLSPTPTVCGYGASFVADVTVPDGTEFAPGAAFTKTWRLRNSGCLNWPAGTKFVFVRGERMGGPDSVPAPAASVGTNVDISVNLTAPSAAGSYRGYWSLEAPDGTRFGQVYVDIKVVVSPTATPTATSTPQTIILTMQPAPLTGNVSSGGCSAQMRAGIAPAGNGIRGLTSFDIHTLQGKTIITATLDLSDYEVDGNPFALEPLIVEQVTFNDVCMEYPNTYNSGNEIVRLARISTAAELATPIDVKSALTAYLGGSPPPSYFQIRIRWKNDDAGPASASMIRWPTMRLIVVYQ